MSEFTVIQVEYNDADAIKAALKEMGYVFEEHKIEQSLYGYAGDLRKQKANIIIRRKHVGTVSNDVGFRKVGNKYELIISEYDCRVGCKSEQNFMHNLKQLYAKHKIVKQLKRMGMVGSVKKIKGNRIKIKAFV